MRRPHGVLGALVAALVVLAGTVSTESPVSADSAPTVGSTATYRNIAGPHDIVSGPDGNFWFTDSTNDTVGKITPLGAVTLYTDPSISQPWEIVVGPDSALWFTNNGWGAGNTIGRITTSGVITHFTSGSIQAPRGITVGPDHALWFTSHNNAHLAIGRLATDGTMTTYTDPGLRGPEAITVGSDGGLWFTDDGDGSIDGIGSGGSIGRIDPGSHQIVLHALSPTAMGGPTSIVNGPDGQLWFAIPGRDDEWGNHTDGAIGTMSPGTGAYGSVTAPTIISPQGIAVGSDGNLWFTNRSVPIQCPPCGTTPSIGRVTTGGVVSDFTDGHLDQPEGITTAPDGSLWFTNSGGGGLGNSIQRVTTNGTFSAPFTGNGMYAPIGIVTGPDGALWFTNTGGGSSIPSYSSIGRIATTGAITSFRDPASNAPLNIAQPQDIILGPDGNLWFTNNGWGGGNMIGRITPSGVVTSYSTGAALQEIGITNGPDGAMWFTSPPGMGPTPAEPAIGRITTDGTITNVYPIPDLTGPVEITTGYDGALWFTDDGGQIGRVTTAGQFTFFPDTRIQHPQGIVLGPDHAVWFANAGSYDEDGNLTGSSIGRITTDGQLSFYTDPSIVTPYRITTGPDGALWFTGGGPVGRIAMDGSVSSYPVEGLSAGTSGITTGPDGAIWFTSPNNVIGRIALQTGSLSPASVTAGSGQLTLTVNGTGFVNGAEVRWDGSPLATTFVSNSQLQATVPAADVASAGTFAVSVANPGSPPFNPLAFYVTETNTTISGSDASTSTSPTGTAIAFAGATSAAASGAGTVIVSQYSSDPVTAAPASPATSFFDVYLAPDSSFSAVTVTTCSTAGHVLYWFDGTQWALVSPQSYDPSTGCITAMLSNTSSPSSLQLTGTPFAAVDLGLPGAVGLSGVSISGSSSIDSFSSGSGPYSTSNHGSAATLAANSGTITVSNAQVSGDVQAATGSVVLQSGRVTGSITAPALTSSRGSYGSYVKAGAPAIDAPPPPACNTTGGYSPAPTTASPWITGKYTYSPSTGNLSLGKGATVTLASGTYCLNSVTISDRSTLTMTGAVALHLTGRFTVSGGSVVNSTAIPTNLHVSTSYTGSGGVTFSGASDAYLTIYAPGTGITISGGSRLDGQVLGKTLTISGGSAVHDDLAATNGP